MQVPQERKGRTDKPDNQVQILQPKPVQQQHYLQVPVQLNQKIDQKDSVKKRQPDALEKDF